MMQWVRIILASLFMGLAAACSPGEEAAISVLRIGILPDQSEENLRARYAPLLVHLKDETGIPVELVVPKSYKSLLRLFSEKKIDLAYFGGFTFLKASHADGALPVVMRDVDTRFRSYFLVRADDTARNMRDKHGARLSFGSRLSTSGHLMPRHYLKQNNIEPEHFFAKVEYSGAHDKTAYRVRDGETDLGAVNAIIADQMFRDGRLKRSQVRVLWETPPYPDYVWAIRGTIAEELRTRVRDAFLSLSADNPVHVEIMKKIGARTFLPVRADDFEQLREVAEGLELLS